MESVNPLVSTELGAKDTSPSSSAAPPAELLPRGATVDRYVVVDPLGAGGMGVVYSAYDAVLDRKIALKLLRADRTREDELQAAHARLLREAQAMARLSHPNVLSVHDVGTVSDRVFIAMEFVDGGTLRQWLEERPRSFREVLSIFLQAGRGLQAAHAVGLIHRDFKPDNVLLSKSGRVYVSDFGLARQALAPVPDKLPQPVDMGSAISGVLSLPLTQTGAILGTPAYMAPELCEGKIADEKADQFSYCVALYEALYRQRPFAGDDVLKILSEASRGRVREPPRDTPVPRRIQRILWRGLSPHPEERYPSMEALLRELEWTPRQVTLRILSALLVLVLLFGVGYAYFAAMRPKRVCEVMAEKLADAWNQERRQSVRAAFAATGKPYAESSVQEVERVLGEYAQAWAATHRDACQAEQARREQTRELLEERMECLQHRLQEAQSLIGIFARADAAVVEKAVPAVHALTSVDGCAEREALEAPQPPADPAVRRQVEQLRSRLAMAKALHDSGRYEDGLPIAAAVMESGRRLSYRPVEAEALLLLGELQMRAGKTLEAERTLYDAVFAAEAGRHHPVAALASADLVEVLGNRGQFALAHHWARHAAARNEGLGGNGELTAILLHYQATVYNAQGQYAEALELAQKAVAVRRKLSGSEHFMLIAPLCTTGQILLNLGRHDAALAHLQEALRIGRKRLGAAHVLVASSLNTIAGVNLLLARFADAKDYFQQALAINQAALGPMHPDVGRILFGLASICLRQGLYEDGLRYSEQASGIFTAAFGSGSLQAAKTFVNIGYARMRLGRYKDGLQDAQEALSLFEKQDVDSHLLHRGYALLTAGESYLGLHTPEQAVAPLEMAVALFESSRADMDALATSQFALARSLWEKKPSRDRALALARQAQGLFSAQFDPRLRAQLDHWLAHHHQGGAAVPAGSGSK